MTVNMQDIYILKNIFPLKVIPSINNLKGLAAVCLAIDQKTYTRGNGWLRQHVTTLQRDETRHGNNRYGSLCKIF